MKVAIRYGKTKVVEIPDNLLQPSSIKEEVPYWSKWSLKEGVTEEDIKKLINDMDCDIYCVEDMTESPIAEF